MQNNGFHIFLIWLLQCSPVEWKDERCKLHMKVIFFKLFELFLELLKLSNRLSFLSFCEVFVISDVFHFLWIQLFFKKFLRCSLSYNIKIYICLKNLLKSYLNRLKRSQTWLKKIPAQVMSSNHKFRKQRFVDSFTGIRRNVGQRTSDSPQFVEAKTFWWPYHKRTVFKCDRQDRPGQLWL